MATPQDEVAAFEKTLGPHIDPATQQLIGLELEAGTARNTSVGPNAWANDQYDAFQGAWVPPNMDESQWQATVTAVQTWAANTDFRGVPSWQNIVNLYEWGTKQGISMTDSRSVAGYLANLLPADQKQNMPWAASGMNQTAWHDSVSSLSDQVEALTGQPASGDLLNQIHDAINSGQSTADFMTKLKQSQPFQAGGQYGYVAQGMNYDTYQQYKNNPQTRQQIIARFGSGAANSDQAYMENLQNPLTATASRGGSIQPTSARTEANKSSLSSIR